MAQPVPPSHESPGLERHFGLLHATALNISMIVGAGVFVTIPFMLDKLPGPYALLGWLAAGLLIMVDGLIWSELGATLPGSGGSYLYLLESYGRRRWGRLMAFLFVWQFLLSGPMEVATALIAIAIFAAALHPHIAAFNAEYTWKYVFWPDAELAVGISPTRVLALGLGVLILLLLYRRITSLGRLTVTLWLGVLTVIGWILVDGLIHFDPSVAFDFSGRAATWPANFGTGLRDLGEAMVLAMYSYLGYYNICYVGDEVRDPGRTIPRAIILSAVAVVILFAGLHLAMLGTVSWHKVPTQSPQVDEYSLPAEFMRLLHGGSEGEGEGQGEGNWAVVLVTLLLIWSCFGSAFAGLLGYSRIPYGAARYGHFFASLGQVHPRHQIPHVSLLFVGGLTLFWSLFDLQNVINALITTRILEQFVAQIVGVVLLRWREPDRPRPFRLWFYPVPCGVALAGWLYLYWAAGTAFVALGLVTLLVGVVIFLTWSWRGKEWPFAR
jgi:amino acid transporter